MLLNQSARKDNPPSGSSSSKVQKTAPLEAQHNTPAVQKVLDSTSYGSHPRMKRLDSPISRALNAEKDVQKAVSGRSGKQAPNSEPRKRVSPYELDLPIRSQPGMQRVNGMRIESTMNTQKRTRRVSESINTGGELAPAHSIPPCSVVTFGETQKRDELAFKHSDAILPGNDSASPSVPLSPAMRHALVMRRRTMEPGEQMSTLKPDGVFKDSKLPAPSSFSMAHKIRSKSTSTNTVVEDPKSFGDEIQTIRFRKRIPSFHSKFRENMSEANASYTSIDMHAFSSEPNLNHRGKVKRDKHDHGTRTGVICKFVFAGWC